jgi:hypothetical protein
MSRPSRLPRLALALAAGVSILLAASCAPHDDTDPPGGRSGLRLFTDHHTGCQYLGNPFGGITPRVDREGRHICNVDR